MRWIKVDDKVIAVPKKIYDKIKVEDTVELTDNTHIKINSHTYTRYGDEIIGYYNCSVYFKFWYMCGIRILDKNFKVLA